MKESRVLSAPFLALMWFAAAVSLAEILTGTFFAPLGFERGMLAIAVGHVIGGALFFAVSYVSAACGSSAMQVVGRSFGRIGSALFASANVVQLVGWTAIMIASGAMAACVLVPHIGFIGWAIAIGALIALWIAVSIRFMSWVQSVAAALLFLLTVVVSAVVFGPEIGLATGTGVVHAPDAQSNGFLSFGAAVEMAVAMPLSWLPVVGDYTSRSVRPLRGALSATVAYTLGSCWMFAIGLGCALYAGSDDVTGVLSTAGLGVAGILVVVLSTVTTTFLDAQSAGESARAIHSRIDARIGGIVAAVAGTVLACMAPVGDFEEFLYLIGSVFAPLAAIVCVDYFVLKRDVADKRIDWLNMVIWLAGFLLYRFSLSWDLPCGNTLPVMCAIALVAIVANRVKPR